jgi:hypothetical protein
MAKRESKEIVVLLFLVFSIFCLLPSQVQAQAITAPTINSISAIDNNTTAIEGTTVINTDVMLFLDNRFIGSVTTNLSESLSVNVGFSYILKKDLANGQHILSAIAHDSKTQTISDYSRPFIFIVSEKKEISASDQADNEASKNLPPAPVLQDPPLVNNDGRLVIVGWVKNDLKINIFLDEKPLVSFLANNNETGTANFGYVLRQILANGGHLLYATATNSHNEESSRSNYLYYLAGSSDNNKELPDRKTSKPAEISEENKTSDSVDNALSDILKQKQSNNNDKSGMVDEKKEMQGKLKWNLIIFILFLIAVIIWVVWVNRELIKEKREQNKKPEEKNNQDKLV